MYRKEKGQSGLGIALGIFAALVVIVVIFAAIPRYRVYSQEAAGEALLKEAQYTRQISELDAIAKVNIAQGEAKAEVERAKGAAEANAILADSLKGQTEYLQYLYIQALAQGNNREVIYVPTEGLLPITEAGRAVKPEVETP
jgi:hypothetical protein